MNADCQDGAHTVSVIIVNFNGRHHLERCLPSLFLTRGVDLEVIVVDNASRDDSVAWLARCHPQVRVIAEPRNHGFGQANLIGARASSRPFLAFLNSDTEVEPDWLRALLAPFQTDSSIAATCAKLLLLGRDGLLNARGGGMSRLGFGFDIDFGLPDAAPRHAADLEPRDVLFPSGAAMLMRREEFLEFGGFDPAMFMYHEDVDLGWRLWLRGRRVVYCPEARVHHLLGGTSDVEMGRRWRDVMGNRHNVRTLWKCYEAKNAIRATAALAWRWLSRGHLGFAASVFSWNLLHARDTWRERRRIQGVRRITDDALFERGLIVNSTPRSPDLSVTEPVSAACALPSINVLWPGRSSGLGRLGAGWYPQETVDGEPCRLAADGAAARLYLRPLTRGMLALRLHVAHEAHAATVEVRCNGTTGTVNLRPGWQCMEVPARVDADGEVQVEFRQWPGGSPLHVAEIRFNGQEPQPRPRAGTVTVLITTYNRRDILERTLEALSDQTWRDFDVVVIDDGSTDGTWAYLQDRARAGDARLTIATQANTGQALARNHGLKLVRSDIVLFLGDDTIPEPDFVAEHMRVHQEADSPVAVVGYTTWDREAMRVTPALNFINEAGYQFSYRDMVDGSDVPYTRFYTSNISVPRIALGDEAFDPRFRHYGWEDIELGYRLSRAGLRIIYHRKACVRHRHPMTFREIHRRQIKVGAALDTLFEVQPRLRSDPSFPSRFRPLWWRRLLHLVSPPVLCLISVCDARSLRLPELAYKLVLADAFWLGRERGHRNA